MINQELEQNLNNAFKLAQDQKHEFVTVEHLLLALLENSDSIALLTSNKVNIEQLRVDLQEFIGSTTPKISNKTEIDIQPTLGFQRVIQRAVFHVQSSGKDEVKDLLKIKDDNISEDSSSGSDLLNNMKKKIQ